MTRDDTPTAERRRGVGPITWIALGITVAWTGWLIFEFSRPDLNTSLAALYQLSLTFVAAFVVVPACIVLNALAGRRKGVSRVVGVIGGCLLLVPAAVALVLTLVDSRN